MEWKKTDPARFDKLKGLVSAELPQQVPPDAKDEQAKEKSGVVEALLDAASQAGLKDLTPVIEQMAGDAKWNVGVRVAAVKALMLVGRKESLGVLKQCEKETAHPMLVKFAKLAVQGVERAK